MSGNWRTWVVVGLGIAVVSAAIYFPILRRRVKTAAKIAEPSEEQARRELTQAITQNASDPVVKVKMFWTSSEDESALAPVTIQLALSKDAALRAKQVINTLLAGPVDSDLRTLPPEKWAELHPIRRMPGLGLKIHPNTDDPTLHKVNPSQAWELMFSHFGFGINDLRGFMVNGIDGAWIDEATREAWRTQWLGEFDALARALP